MVRMWIVALMGSMVVAAATAMGSPRGGQTSVVRSEQARGAEALMDLLEQRELALKRRETTLQAREADLRAAEEEVTKRLTDLQGLRDEITEMLTDLDAQQKARVTKLVKMMESVRDKQAAAILSVTDDTVALKVLMRMNVAKAGKALAAMEPARAAQFAQKMGAPPLSAEAP